MKQLYIFLTLLILFSSTSFAQTENAEVSGQVKDAGGQALPFATALLYSYPDSSFVKAGYSDESGVFRLFPLPAGRYYLRLTFSGLSPHESAAFSLSAGQKHEFAPIQLQEVDATLADVQITAHKPMITIKPDMTVFNVANSPIAIGSDAFELLRKAPGVVVDNNDNIRLLGKSGVRIYINGKPSPLSSEDLAALLKSMSSNDIDAIEIITNPSAKYDAEGNAGVINIRLKKDQRLGANATINAGYAVGIYSRYNGGISTNYRNKHVNAFGTYNLMTGAGWESIKIDRTQNGLRIVQNSETVRSGRHHNIRGGADFNLDKRHTLGLLASVYTGKGARSTRSQSRIADLASDQTESYLLSNTEDDRSNQNLNFNLNYRFEGENGKTWNMDADYGRFSFDNTVWQPNTYLAPNRSTTLLERNFRLVTPTAIDIYTVKADHERPLLGGAFGAGAKFSWVTTDNDFNFYDVQGGEDLLNDNRSNQFVYRENINAAYFTYQRSVKKLTFSGGLRAEQTNSLGQLIAATPTANDEVKRNYLSLFPSGGISYAASLKHNYRLNYSRRIDRPRYDNLNPFETQLDELTYRRGNPFLQPQFTHSIELSHTFKQRLTSTLSYSYTDGLITDILDTTEARRTFQTTVNLAQQQVLSLNVAAPFSITPKWSTYTTATGIYLRNYSNFGPGKEIDLQNVTWNVYHQSTFLLPKSFSLQLSGSYNAPALWMANLLSGDIWGVNAGLTWQFAEGRGSLQASVNDIFWGMRWEGRQEFGDLTFLANGANETREFKLNLRWQIGNGQVKSRKRKTGLEDEKGRI